jgi:arginyl-tRNA synthetase
MLLEQITDELTETIKSRVLTLFGHAIDRVVLQAPPRLNMGDLATPVCLELAKALKRKPRELAEALARDFPLPMFVKAVTVEGAGYLNFRFDRGAFAAAHIQSVMAPLAPAGERVIVEHTNINPNKAAHIGHVRNAVMGDTLVRCLKWLGNHVETQNYIDDTGVQVADVVVAFRSVEAKQLAEVEAMSREPRFDYVCWDVYSKIATLYAEDKSKLQLRQETLHEIEHGGEAAHWAEVISRAIVRRHIATMLRLDITYDLLPKESDIIKLHFWQHAFELLKKSGAVVLETEGKHKGCWVMKLEETEEFKGMDEPDKILVRSNGTVTYTGKDIAYQLWKFGLLDQTFQYRKFFTYADGHVLWESTSQDGSPDAPRFGGAQRVFNVIDVRQSYLQKVVREGLRLLGHTREAENSIHFSYEMVALTPATAQQLGIDVAPDDAKKAYIEMSGRKGLGVKADDLLDALQSKATEAVREGSRREGLSDDEIEQLGRYIAVGALRYFMLKYGRNKVIAFDFNEALTFEGDSGPYLQYSTVRVLNIFRKMKDRGVDARIDDASLDALTLSGDLDDEMWELIRRSADMPAAIRRAVDSLELSVITHELFELCQKFNSFYHKYPILNESDAAERQKRALCAETFRRTMVAALDLLGIPVPDRM